MLTEVNLDEIYDYDSNKTSRGLISHLFPKEGINPRRPLNKSLTSQ